MQGMILLKSGAHAFKPTGEIREKGKIVPVRCIVYKCSGCGLDGEMRDWEGNDCVEAIVSTMKQLTECHPSEVPKKKSINNFLKNIDI